MNDEELWAAFAASALPHEQWTHEAHVRMASLFLQRFTLDEAHLRLRAGILRLNERHGLIETSSRGYFETLTRAWLVLVAAARQRSATESSVEVTHALPRIARSNLSPSPLLQRAIEQHARPIDFRRARSGTAPGSERNGIRLSIASLVRQERAACTSLRAVAKLR